MTEYKEQRYLEHQLIRAYALADEWFDLLSRARFNNQFYNKIESCLTDLGEQLRFLESLPIQQSDDIRHEPLSHGELEQLHSIVKQCDCEQQNTQGLRQRMRDYLHHTLILLELDSTSELHAQAICMPHGEKISTEQFLQLMVFTMNRILFDLSTLKADADSD